MPKSASLEIHQINVGQGDSILIINRDLDKVRAALQQKDSSLPGSAEKIDWVPRAIKEKATLFGTVKYALLIDGGDDEYGGDVVAYLEQHGVVDSTPTASPFCPNFYVLVSHYHDDHMAGLRSVFKKRVEYSVFDKKKKKKVKKVCLEERYRPARVYYTAPDHKADPDTQRFGMLWADINEAHTAATNKTELYAITRGGIPESGGTKMTEISLGTGIANIPIVLKAIAAAQSIYKPGGSISNVTSVTRKVDQNDRSIVLVLEYGSFRYFLGGDIAGNGLEEGGNTGDNKMDAGGKRFFSVHADVETELSGALKSVFPATTGYSAGQPKYPWDGYCTVFKANHHGSSSSVDVYFLSTLRPMLAVISSGLKSRFHNHPTQQVMNRMSSSKSATWGIRGNSTETVPNSIQQIYITEVAKKAKNKTFSTNIHDARILGDIVIRPIDESIREVHQATASGTKLNVQVYGSGVQSELADPDNVVREVTNVMAAEPYPVGPWYHEDTH